MKMKCATAIILAVVLTVTAVPVTELSASEDSDEVQFIQTGETSFVLQQDFLERQFGITQPNPSDITDPVGHNPIGITPLEITTVGNDGYTNTYEYNTGEKIDSSREVFGDQMYSVYFAASLTTGCTQKEAASQSLFSNPNDLRKDWYCALCFDSNNNYDLRLYVKNENVSTYISVYNSTGCMTYPKDQIDYINTIQASNILKYAVGDFDGDGCDEIAIHHRFCIYIYGLSISNGSLGLESTVELKTYPGYDNTLFTPVSMAVGDIDKDGKDELAIARGYYKNGVVGNSEFTDLIIYNYGSGASTYRVSVNDPDNPSRMLDSVMTGVTMADVDGDRQLELVLGGFMWNNSNTSFDYTPYWENSEGELYLGYLEYSDLRNNNVSWNGLTKIGDDNGLATTRYVENNSDFANNYKINPVHNPRDTSIYPDTDDNPSGLCRSVNWSNWTIPMEGIYIEGFRDEMTKEQVFFDKWFYGFNGSSFVVKYQTPAFTRVMDDNNLMCISLTAGQITCQDNDSYDGTEKLFLSYAVDQHETFDYGQTEWTYVVYGNNGTSTASAEYGNGTKVIYRSLTDYGKVRVGGVFVGNFDNDTVYADLLYSLYTYTDPEVLAVISPIPYDVDLPDLVISSDYIGTTSYTEYISDESSLESTVTVSAGPTIQLGTEKIFAFDGSMNFSHDESWTDSTTMTISTTYESSHGSVAMFVIPVDVYIYNLYTPDGNGGYVKTIDTLTYRHAAINTVLELEEYYDFIDEYNTKMSKVLGDDYQATPKVMMYDFTEGDLDSYGKDPTKPMVIQTVHYDLGGKGSYVTKTVDLSESTGSGVSTGGTVAISAMAGGLLKKAGIEAEFGGSSLTSNVSTNGMAFSSKLAQSGESLYMGDSADEVAVLSQYTMDGTFWAEKRTYTIADGSENEYIFIGYTVSDYNVAPHLATIAPDVYIPDGSDEDDPYNPTHDAVFMEVSLPAKENNYHMNADEFWIQVGWQGYWYTVDGNVLGFTAYRLNADGEWIPFNGKLTSEDAGSKVWVKVDGLSNVDNLELDFRVNSVRLEGTIEHINPSLPVTCYKDTRHVDEGVQMVHGTFVKPYMIPHRDVNGSSVILIEDSAFNYRNSSHLFLKTDLAAGKLADVWYSYKGDYIKLADNEFVTYDGYIIFEHESNGFDGHDKTTIRAMSILCIVIGLMIAASVRKS